VGVGQGLRVLRDDAIRFGAELGACVVPRVPSGLYFVDRFVGFGSCEGHPAYVSRYGLNGLGVAKVAWHSLCGSIFSVFGVGWDEFIQILLLQCLCHSPFTLQRLPYTNNVETPFFSSSSAGQSINIIRIFTTFSLW
jgi:hypothetical protein